jgi:DNA-binding transcriptional ArsR family regulator
MNQMSQQDDLFADPESLKAELAWFHIFRAMIHSPEFAKMEGSAVKVYLVIKAHTNFQTGAAFPKIETICEKAGYSEPQVKRILKDLVEQGLITKSKEGRHNTYRLRERVEIQDEKGRPAAVATWDYLPGAVQQAVAELRQVLVTGKLGGANIVHIEKLQINVNNLHDNAVNFNVQQFMADIDKLPPNMRAAAREALDRKGREDGDDHSSLK